MEFQSVDVKQVEGLAPLKRSHDHSFRQSNLFDITTVCAAYLGSHGCVSRWAFLGGQCRQDRVTSRALNIMGSIRFASHVFQT